MFRVNGPYLNLLVKPRIFSAFLQKYNFMHFGRHKIVFFPKNNNTKNYVCLPYLKFSDPLPEKHLFFYLV